MPRAKRSVDNVGIHGSIVSVETWCDAKSSVELANRQEAGSWYGKSFYGLEPNCKQVGWGVSSGGDGSIANVTVFLYTVTCQVSGHLLNGKIVYVGQTVDPVIRWKQHCTSQRKRGPLQTAIQACGANWFCFEVVACCRTYAIANAVELDLISFHATQYALGRGYNVSLKPQVRNTKVKHLTERERISIILEEKDMRRIKAWVAKIRNLRRSKMYAHKTKAITVREQARRKFLTEGLDELLKLQRLE